MMYLLSFKFVLCLFGDAVCYLSAVLVVVVASLYASSPGWQVLRLALPFAHPDREMMILFFSVPFVGVFVCVVDGEVLFCDSSV